MSPQPQPNREYQNQRDRDHHPRACIYAALLALLIPATAFAQTPNQKAKAEAIRFLPSCPATDVNVRKFCLRDQTDFIEQYMRAKSGDVAAMDAVAESFRPEAHEFHLGLPMSYAESCAWRRVVLRVAYNKNNFDHFREECDHIPKAHEIASIKRATVLMKELETAPTKPDSLYSGVPRSHLDGTLPDSR